MKILYNELKIVPKKKRMTTTKYDKMILTHFSISIIKSNIHLFRCKYSFWRTVTPMTLSNESQNRFCSMKQRVSFFVS